MVVYDVHTADSAGAMAVSGREALPRPLLPLRASYVSCLSGGVLHMCQIEEWLVHVSGGTSNQASPDVGAAVSAFPPSRPEITPTTRQMAKTSLTSM